MIDKITEVASNVAEGLRTQPLALALVVINVLFLVAGLWIVGKVATGTERRDALLMQLVKECKP